MPHWISDIIFRNRKAQCWKQISGALWILKSFTCFH